MSYVLLLILLDISDESNAHRRLFSLLKVYVGDKLEMMGHVTYFSTMVVNKFSTLSTEQAVTPLLSTNAVHKFSTTSSAGG